LEAVLRQVLEVARELTGARYAALGILNEEKSELDRFLFVGIDDETRARIGPLPRGRGILGELIRSPHPLRLDRIDEDPRSYGFPLGHPPMTTFLGVPLEIRGEAYGNLYLTDKDGGALFDEVDEELVVLLSQWAAVAIDNARSIGAERLRLSLEAAEGERRRWARELHDEALQELGALKVLLDAGRNGGSDAVRPEVFDRAIAHVEHGIRSLEEIIADLRPASLDELGLAAAVEALAERTAATSTMDISTHVDLGARAGGVPMRLMPELEVAIYRLVQEAVRNAVKHADATVVRIRIMQHGDLIDVAVDDDGRGFDPAGVGSGLGLLGMKERVSLAGGAVQIESDSSVGTTVSARFTLG
jgi:signal transduction histidine kinase